MRLVSRKLRSSCWTRRAIRDLAVISVSFACNTVRACKATRGTPRLTRSSSTLLGGLALAVLLRKLQIRLQLSRAKHRSLAGHSRMARRFASLVPFYEYDEHSSSRADACAGDRRRRAARGLHAARRRLRRALPEDGGADRRDRRQRLRPAIHLPLPRAVSIQRLRAAALQNRRLRRSPPPA